MKIFSRDKHGNQIIRDMGDMDGLWYEDNFGHLWSAKLVNGRLYPTGQLRREPRNETRTVSSVREAITAAIRRATQRT